MLLINSSFVGGLGSARKAASFVRYLKHRGVEYRLVTDSQSLSKLRLVGLSAHLVFEVLAGMSSSEIYGQVRRTLRQVQYEGMISFGWRTYVPADAVERSKPAIIIDGGWPRLVEDWPSPFCKDVYRELSAYCLTNYFFDNRLDRLLPRVCGIPFAWIAQPFDEEEVLWHQALGDSRDIIRAELAPNERVSRVIFLDMNPEYVYPDQGTFTGGWLTPRQLDECRGFASRLLVELDRSEERVGLVLHERIAEELSPVIRQCRNLKVFSQPSLPPKDHHRWRAGADLVLLRATRCVGATQTALSAVPALHTICPTADDYMGEQSTCNIAEDLGLADCLDHERASLCAKVMEYIDLQRACETAERAQEAALRFWKERGPEYLLDLIGLSSRAGAS